MGDEYDDDFEDYDGDDFEDEDEQDTGAAAAAAAKEAEAIRRAQLARQEQALRERPPPQSNISRGPAVPRQQPAMMQPPPMEKPVPLESAPAPRRFIAPPSNQDRQLKEQRAARLKALRSVLQLRAVDVTLYDAAPLTPYELHTRHASTKRVKMVQTGDDDVSIGVQTEEIETDARACQWPEDGTAPGTSTSMETSASARTAGLLTANVGRLRRFLSSAGQVVETLCLENLMAATGAADAVQLPNSIPFSTRHMRLTLPTAFGQRVPHDLCFDSSGGGLLVAYGKALDGEPPTDVAVRKRDAAALKRLASGGFLALWKIYTPEAPWAVMRCAGVPSCCMLPEAKPHLAFAGTEEGSVQLWNMREPGASHPSIELGANTDRLALRSPTYASDCLANGSHTSPIVTLVALPVSGDAEDASLSIASLDAEGTLVTWLVLESVELDALDLGQAVGGKDRLLLSGTTFVVGAAGGARSSPLAAASASVLPTRCLDMRFLPTDASRLLVATDLPGVLQRSRYSPEPPSPEAFAPEGSLASGVSSLAFHPKLPSYFLAGRTDGSVTLNHVDDPQPLLTYVGFAGGGIAQLRWSPSRPAIFWVLDADDCMHVFDVVDGEGKPLISTPVRTREGGSGGAVEAGGGAIESSRRMRFDLDARTEVATTKVGSGGARQRLAAITCRGESRLEGVEVHVLTENMSQLLPDELQKVEHVLGKL